MNLLIQENAIINNKYSNQYLLLTVVLYFINPLFGIGALIINIVQYKQEQIKYYYTLIFMISCYLGLIAMTKVKITDLGQYIDEYNLCKNKTFFEYLSLFNKEYIFYTFNYILYQVFAGMSNMYVFSIISLGYYLLLISVLHYFKNQYNEDSMVALYSIIFISFFELYFAWVAHLVRQILSSTFFIYFIIQYYVKHKRLWWAVIISIFIHSASMLFFVIFIVIELTKINKNLSLNLIRSILLSLLLIISFGYLYNLLHNIYPFDYIFSRIEEERIVDSSNIYATDWIIPNVILYTMLIISLYILFRKKTEHYEKSLLIMYLFYFVFMIYELKSDNYLLAYRMMIYIYMFMPFILFMPLRYSGNKFIYPLYISIVLIVFFRFFRSLSLSGYYASLEQILFFPPLLYF